MAAIVAIGVPGCASAPSPCDDVAARQMAYFADLADAAEASDASSVQVSALRSAAATGDLTTEMVTELYEPLFECFAALGGTGEVYGTVEVAPGIVVPDYRVGFPEDADAAGGDDLDAQVRACQDKHVEFVWQALYLQPKAVDARNALMMTSIDTIRTCLKGVGLPLPEDPSPDEVTSALAEAQSLGTQCYTAPGDAGS